MEQVAHQAVAMQFILEMARSVQQDPRACFRQFFQKAKAGQEGYLDVFHTELEAFKHRVREYAVKPKVDTPKAPEQQCTPSSSRLDPKEVLESLPPELKACIQSQDMHILQNVLSTMNPQKEALMEQVAHQAVAMQFILEMARSVQQDPRACFRQFFQKAKAGQEGYLDVFHTELEAFKHRVREYAVKPKVDTPKAPEQQCTPSSSRLDPKEVLESLPPELKACIQSQNMHILQNVLSTMNPQVAEYHIKRCLEAGLCSHPGRGSKDEDTETEDQRMMETF
ncbi:hypothetical protein PGIGA_G00087870 [Pangasianodon gigas]|uniref:Uncharacterized protein n=1 Tax=Pangasianodon gigas TaxID=30993 RepID=A0ACC5XCD9_PANGG|nr:hypothetical protein [Pangasianodon gigas]